jgi:hypothetical protein
MGLREALNENPRIAITSVAGTVVLAGVLALAFRWGDAAPETTLLGGQAFFSADEGKTWFTDDIRKVPPFIKDGKENLRVYVFSCPERKSFVSYLVRFTPRVKQQIEAMYALPTEQQNSLMIGETSKEGLEIKAPGQTVWLKPSDPRGGDLTMPKCANGEYAEPVLP